MEIKGYIKVIKEIQQISDKFQKREFVIETDEQFKQCIQLELHQDKVDIIDAYSVGELVTVSINIRGKLWTNQQGEDKYFNTILAWRIQRENSQQPPSQDYGNMTPLPSTGPQEFKQANQPNSFVDSDENLDLPF